MENLHSTVGVYKSHNEAMDAVKALKAADFKPKNISVIGKGDLIEDHIHITTPESTMEKTATVGGLLGGLLGLVTGIGLVSIPGLGVLFMGGALAGTMGGLSIGLAGGGAAGALAAVGIGKDGLVRYEDHLKIGKYLVILHNENEDKIHKAKEVLHTETDLQEVEVYLNEKVAS